MQHTHCCVPLKVLEGRSYRLLHPWVGIVNRSQADINKNVDMIAARRREREFFATSPDYGHLSSKMGSEYLAKLLSKVCVRLFHFKCEDLLFFCLLIFYRMAAYFLLLIRFQHLEAVIRARIPSITSLINKSIDELEGELDHLGRPIAIDAGVRSFISVSYIFLKKKSFFFAFLTRVILFECIRLNYIPF